MIDIRKDQTLCNFAVVAMQTSHCASYQMTDKAQVHGTSVTCSIKARERNLTELRKGSACFQSAVICVSYVSRGSLLLT